MRYKIFFIVCLFNSSFVFGEQKLMSTDSLEVCRITNTFFDWYLGAIKNHGTYQPEFVENEEGMTTLDFEEYLENLKKYNFSEALIIKEKSSYDSCLREIEKIKFVDFEENFVDLDQFEAIDCDFSNYYRWTGGQEAFEISEIKIKNVKMISVNQIEVMIEYCLTDKDDNCIICNGENGIIFLKIKNDWKIDDIYSFSR